MNIGYVSLRLEPAPPPTARRVAPASGEVFFGAIPRRLPADRPRERQRSVVFQAEYVLGRPQRAWCDANMNGDLTDDPPLKLWQYPEPEGARSFLTGLRWTARLDGKDFAVEWKVRVALEPRKSSDRDPEYHVQRVYAMTGTVTLEGRAHRAILYDGNSDGLYTPAFMDGLYVDLDGDGRFTLDPMSEGFGPFSVPFQMGSRQYEVLALDPEGRALTLRELAAVPPAEPAVVGRPAPPFSYRDLNGREVRLGDYRGRFVLVYFWAAWCGNCAEDAPAMARLYRRFQPRGLEILAVSYDTDRESMEEFREKHGHSWPTSFTGRMFFEDPVGRLYGANKLAHGYLVDREGRLEGIYNDPETLASRLEQLLR